MSLLTSIALSSLNTARAKARDSFRIQTLNQVQKAIEAYFIENGVYPTCGVAATCITTTPLPTPSTVWGSMSAMQIVPTYIPSIPNDPRNQSGEYGFYYVRGYKKTGVNTYTSDSSTVNNYMLATRLEVGGLLFSPPTAWNNSKLNYLIGN